MSHCKGSSSLVPRRSVGGKGTPSTTCMRMHVIINPRRACAARVTVVVCVCVCLSVCLSVKSKLTSGASVRPETSVTYSTGNKGQKIYGVKCIHFKILD